jgi:DNA-binding transcriptional MocR family regulator
VLPHVSEPAWGKFYLDWPIDKLTGAETKVLCILDGHARNGTSKPSRRTIARRTGLHPSTVSECIKGLEHAGIISVRRSGRGRPNQYDLIPPAGRPEATTSAESRSRHGDPARCPETTSVGAPGRPIADNVTDIKTEAEIQEDDAIRQASINKTYEILGGRPRGTKNAQPSDRPHRRSDGVRTDQPGLVPLAAAIKSVSKRRKPPT